MTRVYERLSTITLKSMTSKWSDYFQSEYIYIIKQTKPSHLSLYYHTIPRRDHIHSTLKWDWPTERWSTLSSTYGFLQSLFFVLGRHDRRRKILDQREWLDKFFGTWHFLTRIAVPIIIHFYIG
jgi:hypothetical protein